MAKTLVLVFHPQLGTSTMNARIVKQLALRDDVTVRNIYDIYSTTKGMIYDKADILKEQEQLLLHQCVIFQFPLYWASAPAACKQYMDSVLSMGFAFNYDGTVSKIAHK